MQLNRRLGEIADPAVRERLRRRYPGSRVPRWAAVVLVGAGVAVALGWLLWAALFHADPAVSAQVSAYSVRNDQTIDVKLTVQRGDPQMPVRCRVIAQAADFQIVGERQVEVPATAAQLVDVTVSLTTLRRATSASAKGCERI